MMNHGANIYKYAKELNCSPSDIIDFSSNINLYQPEIKLQFSNAVVTKYADSSYMDLKELIAKEYDIKKSQIALYNGATSAIYELLSSLKQKKVYLYAPMYGEYEKAAVKSKKDIYKINRLEDIDSKIDKKSTVIFVNPSTPEGSYYDLKELFLYWKSRKCNIIIDESFLEFEQGESLRKYIKEYKKLYIIQSFSKFYSCAGVRIGAIFTDKKNISNISSSIWNISSLDVEFLKKRIGDNDFKNRSMELHKIQKMELISILKSSIIFDKIVKSDANFVLVHTSKKVTSLFAHLLKHKILVRTCGSFDYLSNEWLRFAVKDKISHEKLRVALNEFA